MNNHLVPEQRLDKNNRLSTKYVRPVPAVGASTLSMFAPTVHEDPIDKTRRVLKSRGARLKTDFQEKLNRIVDGLSENKLKYASDYMAKGGDVNATHIYRLLDEYDDTAIHEYYTYVDEAPYSEADIQCVMRCIRGVRQYYPDETFEDLAEVSPEMQQTVRALIRVADVIHSWLEVDHPAAAQEWISDREIHNVIAYPDLVELVKEYPEKGEEIAEYIKEHGVENDHSLRAVIESGVHRSLADGYL
jgi:hypothetical protein